MAYWYVRELFHVVSSSRQCRPNHSSEEETNTKGRQMINYGDVLVDEHSQLFTHEGEPIWVTNDGRYIPLTKLEDEHLAAIQDMLRRCGALGPWIGNLAGEVTRRAHEERQLQKR